MPSREDKPIIQFRNLSKVYASRDGNEVIALQDINFKVGDSEFLSVVGPSGCGKSTLLNILCGLLHASNGEALVRGEVVTGPRRDLGIVFQQPLLLPWLRVLDNVLMPVDVQGRPRREYEERALHLLQLVGLTGFEKRYPRELSGGMQQRVAIVRALVHDPSLLLMDEPFSALDAMTREFMNAELLRIWQENRKTVLFITHSISEAVFLSDRVVVMTPRPGRVARIVNVDLPRPRLLSVMNTDHFGVFAGQVRAEFEALNIAAPSEAVLSEALATGVNLLV